MVKAAKGLTIVQRANGSWRAQIRKAGFPHLSKDCLTKADADRWGLAKLAELNATGRLPDERGASRISFAEAIRAYLEKVTSKRPGEASRIAERARLERFLRDETKLCAYALSNLHPRLFAHWMEERRKQTVRRGRPGGRGDPKEAPVPAGRMRKDGSPRKNAATPTIRKPAGTISESTIRREMVLMKRVLDFSMREYGLHANPLAGIELPSASDERDVRITTEQWGKLLGECRASRNASLAPFVELALEVGARRGSLLKLEWKDVHLDRSALTLRGVKNSRAPTVLRTVEIGLSPRAIELLKSIENDGSGRVFPTTASAIKSAFDRARVRAGVPHFRLHDARHELASRLQEAGWGLIDIMAQGDWRDPKSVARYVNLRGNHLGTKLADLGKR